jgi:DNA repair photolyase
MGEHTAKQQVNEDLFAQAPSRLHMPKPWDESSNTPRNAAWLTPENEAPACGALSLFPILQPAATGLARMVETSESRDQGHLVEFRSLAVRSILNKSVSKRKLWFARTINPYRGCEFACRYCYARYTHEFMELKDPADFERQIFIKQNAAWLLEQELRGLDPEEEIAIGTATDPYQPIERRAEVTRSILEVLARRGGHRIGIVTKSTLIERDIDLLQQISHRNELVLHITITTTDAGLARQLEPRAPRPDLRFRTVERLRKAGLRCGILCSPLLPGLTDDMRSLDKMAARAKAADASFFSAQPLFLKPCSRPVFLAFIRDHYPELEASYAARYDSEAFVGKGYAERLRGLVRAVTRKHGLRERMTDAILTRDAGIRPSRPAPAQATLWPGAMPVASAAGSGRGGALRAG